MRPLSPEQMLRALNGRAYDLRTYSSNWEFRSAFLSELEEIIERAPEEITPYLETRKTEIRALIQNGVRSSEAFLEEAKNTADDVIKWCNLKTQDRTAT